jgi:hypothetical protein
MLFLNSHFKAIARRTLQQENDFPQESLIPFTTGKQKLWISLLVW